MIGLSLALAGLALWSVIATIEVVARDGYGPLPIRPLSETYASSLAA